MDQFEAITDDATGRDRKAVVAYRRGRDDTRRVTATDVVIATFFIGVILLMLFFMGLVLFSAWRTGFKGPWMLYIAVFGGCGVFALGAFFAAYQRLSGRRLRSFWAD
jgi:hypothetical protein